MKVLLGVLESMYQGESILYNLSNISLARLVATSSLVIIINPSVIAFTVASAKSFN